MIERDILNACQLVGQVKRVIPTGSFPPVQTNFDFYYKLKKICTVTYTKDHIPIILTTVEPWHICWNNKKEMFLSKITRIENEIHGIDVIEQDYFTTLSVELDVNEQIYMINKKVTF